MCRDVGVILQRISDLGLDDNTIVFFASDNGAHDEGGHNVSFFDSRSVSFSTSSPQRIVNTLIILLMIGSGPLRGYKRSLFEGGIRTASWIRWPGVVTPAMTDQPWAFWDFLPTAADLAGADPSTFPSDIDGVSIVPMLEGRVGPGGYDGMVRQWTFGAPQCASPCDILAWTGRAERSTGSFAPTRNPTLGFLGQDGPMLCGWATGRR